MIGLSFGRWSYASGLTSRRERIYAPAGLGAKARELRYIWTPFVRVKFHELWQLVAHFLPRRLIYHAMIQATAEYSCVASWEETPYIPAMDVARWLDTGDVPIPPAEGTHRVLAHLDGKVTR